jgi:uracil-DNA glycosylase family 4
VLEAPGVEEDKAGKGAVGAAGKLLWDEINKYGYNRRHFHVSNTCRCYPKKSKTPNKEQITECCNWVLDEILKTNCRLVLACGNIVQYALTGQDKGIRDLSGTTEWIEDLGVWVCWCMHPSSVLHQSSNRPYFEKGIENFIQKMELLS